MVKPITAKVIEFKPEHFDTVELEPNELRHSLGFSDTATRLSVYRDGSVISGTIIFHGRVLGAMGFIHHWPGVAEGWVMPTIHIYDHPRIYLRTVKRYIQTAMTTFNYHRLQTVCIDDAIHEKWMGFLGFEPEGRLRKYTTDKANYRLYARVI